MHHRSVWSSTWVNRLTAVALAATLVSPTLKAQETAPVAVPASDAPIANHAAQARAALEHEIALHIDHLTLRQALATIAAQIAVPLVYSPNQDVLNGTVSLVTDKITVHDALGVLLHGTGLVANPLASGVIAIEPTTSTISLRTIPTQQGTATISGLVTDSGTGAIITQVIVHVDGTQLTVRTNATGHYTFSGLVAGEYRVTARHVGYLAKTHPVTVGDSAAKALDFQLNQPATSLNEVVTTAIGDQRRYQVGNVISTINVDSIAPSVPATSITDLITGRAPGVEVVSGSGLVGSGGDIRIRGVSSLLLQGDPIVIVDGVREDNTPGGCAGDFCPMEAPNRLNDIDFSQVESIDILKGPAATTEYGTDGANGVIIITTKRGTSGKPQWNASVSQTASTVPESYPAIQWSWGHMTNGEATPLTSANGSGNSCIIEGGRQDDPIVDDAESGQCIADSTTSFNPLDHAATSMYGSGPFTRYTVDVGGGTDAMRYYFAGAVQNQTGAYHLPSVFDADAIAMGLPGSLIQPNIQQQRSLRASTTIKASATVNVQADVALMSTYATFPDETSLGIGNIAAVNDSVADYGYGRSTTGPQIANGPLGTVILTDGFQNTQRWTGDVGVNWRPASWLAGALTAGVDHEAQINQAYHPPQPELLVTQDTAGNGQISSQQSEQEIYNVNLQQNVTATLWRHFRSLTTVGASYIETRFTAVQAIVAGLSATNFTLNGSTNYDYVGSAATDVKSGGMFVQEDFSYGDRCYAPLGLRFDVASGYGTNVSGTQNPNLQLTCTILSGRTSLRLRGGYGISDQQPPFGANLGSLNILSGQLVGAPVSSTVYILSQPGNQQIRPERDYELEGGLDLGLWNERVHFEFTAYRKKANDLLYQADLGWEVGDESIAENVGNAQNIGLEGTLTTTMIQMRPLLVSLTVNASVNHNKLLTLSPQILNSGNIGNYEEFAAGYPLYGYWGDSIQYTDHGSGELTPADIVIGQTPVFQGTYEPVEDVSASPTIGLWRNSVTIHALLRYEGDFKLLNQSCQNRVNALCDAGATSLQNPLWVQALQYSYANAGDGESNMFLDGTYVDFQELSASVALPRRWVGFLRCRNLGLVLAVRNLALWTRYPYGDPEVSVPDGDSFNNASNLDAVNNDLRRESFGVMPLTRQLTLRVNAGF